MELSCRTLGIALFSFRDIEGHTGYIKLRPCMPDTQLPLGRCQQACIPNGDILMINFAPACTDMPSPGPFSSSVSATRRKYELYANDSTRQGSFLISPKFARLVSSIQP